MNANSSLEEAVLIAGGDPAATLHQALAAKHHESPLPREAVSQPAAPSAQTPNSSLLLSSLRRIYETEPVARQQPQSLAAPTLSKPHGELMFQSTMDLLGSAFDVSELDPLPFLDRRDGFLENAPPIDRPRSVKPSQTDTQETAAPEATNQPNLVRRAEIPPSPWGADRRKLPRREGDCLVTICPHASAERLSHEKISWILHSGKIKGRLIDVSMSGIALSLGEKLADNTKVYLRITNRVLDKYVDAAATVLRCCPDGEAVWNIVCRFDKNLSFQQIHLIGRSLFASTIV